jgi:Protein of unknown function (DUF2752)
MLPLTNPLPPRSRLRTAVLAGGPLVAIALATVLFRYPPEQYSFYPQCPIHQYLHLDCPGCGTTRALAALLHGHLLTALHFNPLTTLLLPVALFYAIGSYLRLLRNQSIHWPQPSTRTLQAALAVTLVFTIVRNL